jgi:hypothetical protein
LFLECRPACRRSDHQRSASPGECRAEALGDFADQQIFARMEMGYVTIAGRKRLGVAGIPGRSGGNLRRMKEARHGHGPKAQAPGWTCAP